MKNLKIFKLIVASAIILFAGNTTFAQNELPMPGGFQEHGNNSSGTPTAAEAIDSVTVTSVMQYWAEPDGSSATDNNFTWTVAPALGSQTNGGVTNIAEVTFGNAPATGTIQVTEGTASCTDLTPVSINVEVIARPTATFGGDPAAMCTNDPVQTYSLPVTLSTAVNSGTMRINYTVYNPDATELIAAQDLDINEATASFDVTLTGATQYGTYYVIINSVSDHISRKPTVDVAGTITDNRIDLVINRTPVTGPIYHLPNL